MQGFDSFGIAAFARTLGVKYKKQDEAAMKILIADLERLPQSEHRDKMIGKAKGLVYSDYNDDDNDDIGNKMALVKDCTLGGEMYEAIAENTKAGKYDTDIKK